MGAMNREHPLRSAIPTSSVKPRKAAEIIAGRLRHAIVEGSLTEGEMLPVERELIESFGVSRATMREALRILETERLVEVARGAKGGAQVARPTLALASHALGMVLQTEGTQLADVQVARQVIEPPAARLAAERSSAERERAVAILRRRIAEERNVAKLAEFPYKAMAFHEALVQLSGNKTLAAFLLVLHDIHEGVAASLSQESHGDGDRVRARAIQYHEHLVRCIADGDGPGAEALWREYWRWITPYTHPEEAVVDVLRNLEGPQ